MKKLKSFWGILLTFLIVANTITYIAVAIPQLNEKQLKYYAVIMGTSMEMVSNLHNDNSYEEFNKIIESMLESRKYTDDMYNLENNITTTDTSLSMNINDCAVLLGIDELTINKHIEICGYSLYNKIINSYISYSEDDIGTTDKSEISTMSSGDGSGSIDQLTDEMWAAIHSSAHTGNILITKDSTSYNYRHGHIGVIQSHTSAQKWVTDAWENENEYLEVMCHVLQEDTSNFGIRATFWSKRSSLCLTYPNTPTVADRESAGNQTWYYAVGTNYTYNALNTKAQAQNSSYLKVNCVGLAVRAYYFMASYDIVPQLNTSSTLLPSHVYYSPNTRFKYNSIGNILRTPNFENIDWGL